MIIWQTCQGQARAYVEGVRLEDGPLALWTAFRQAFGVASVIKAAEARERFHKTSILDHSSRSVTPSLPVFRANEAGLPLTSLDVKLRFVRGLAADSTKSFETFIGSVVPRPSVRCRFHLRSLPVFAPLAPLKTHTCHLETNGPWST